MKKIFLTLAASALLASCAANQGMVEQKALSYQCDNGAQAAMKYHDAQHQSGTLTLSRVTGGNVQARSVALNRITHPAGEAFSNTAEQVQWVGLGNTAELTYPDDSGIVRLYPCRLTM